SGLWCQTSSSPIRMVSRSACPSSFIVGLLPLSKARAVGGWVRRGLVGGPLPRGHRDASDDRRAGVFADRAHRPGPDQAVGEGRLRGEHQGASSSRNTIIEHRKLDRPGKRYTIVTSGLIDLPPTGVMLAES